MTSTQRNRTPLLEQVAFGLTAACLGLVQFNLLAGQTLFGLAAIFWLVVTLRQNTVTDRVPRWFVPLVLYGVLTIASAIGSSDPMASLVDCKQLILLLMVPIVARVARGDRAMSILNVAIAVGAAGAVAGVIEYALTTDPNYRPSGLLKQYMTYSGLVMLIASAAVAHLLFSPTSRVWPAIAVPALLAAVIVTRTRSAWVGLVLAISAMLTIRRARWLIAVPLLVGVVLFVAPGAIRDRAFSIIDLHNPTNRDRIVMAQMGRDMVRDHPWFGVGPEQVKKVYVEYRENYPDAVNPANPHLHNVPIQIAAERGLPALAVWCWFIGLATYDLFQQLRHGPAKAVAGAGLAAMVAMLGAGLFEYNFGDSEFLMLFLGLITLPFAAASGLHRPKQ